MGEKHYRADYEFNFFLPINFRDFFMFLLEKWEYFMFSILRHAWQLKIELSKLISGGKEEEKKSFNVWDEVLICEYSSNFKLNRKMTDLLK